MAIPGYTQNPTGSTSTEDSNPPTQSQRWRSCLTSLASLIPPKLQKRKDRWGRAAREAGGARCPLHLSQAPGAASLLPLLWPGMPFPPSTRLSRPSLWRGGLTPAYRTPTSSPGRRPWGWDVSRGGGSHTCAEGKPARRLGVSPLCPAPQ